MKTDKTLFATLLISSLLLSSCNPTNKQTVPTDTLTTQTPIAEPEPEFITPDLLFAEAQGHIKTITQDNNIHYQFNQDGKLTKYTIGQTTLDEIFRNKKGQIHKIYYEGPGFGVTYTYNQDGKIQLAETAWGEGGEDETYTYDQDGHLAQIKSVTTEWPDPFDDPDNKIVTKETYTYTYLKFDKHGNWIEREQKTSNNKAIIQKRTIEYFEP